MPSRPKRSPSSKDSKAGTARRAVRERAARKPAPSPRGRLAEPSLPLRTIEEATEIVPLWVAESVLNEAEAFLRTPLPVEWPEALAAKAERCFARHRQFHRLICTLGAGGNAGRDKLFQFMRHWLCGRLARERRDLLRRVPHSFALGLPLSQGRG